jgi:mono/diheme cytochrome c family protein
VQAKLKVIGADFKKLASTIKNHEGAVFAKTNPHRLKPVLLVNQGANVNYFREHRTLGIVGLAVILLLSFAHARAQEPKSTSASTGNAENGKRVFMKDGCYQCHGREGQGSNMSGPRIAPNPPPLEVILGYVRKPSGEMPPYTAKVISDQELTDIYAYLQSRPAPSKEKAAQLLK